MLKKHRIDPSIIFDNNTQEGEFKDTVVKGSLATGLSQGIGKTLKNFRYAARGDDDIRVKRVDPESDDENKDSS